MDIQEKINKVLGKFSAEVSNLSEKLANEIREVGQEWVADNQEYKMIFKTKGETVEYIEYLKAKEKAMNEFTKEEWEDTGIFKYRFCINCSTKKFEIILATLSREYNALYFRKRDEVQEFVDKYEKFLKWELEI